MGLGTRGSVGSFRVNPLNSEYLSGKVRKLTLPAVSLLDAAAAPVLKRLLLDQGELAQCFDSADGIHYVACLELLAGTSRGGHFHRKKLEYFCLFRGKVRLVVEDISLGAAAALELAGGDRTVIEPGIAHVYEVIEPGWAVEFSPARFDPADIFRHEPRKPAPGG
jgi:hypothetical protein